jgi:hypothetical protein
LAMFFSPGSSSSTARSSPWQDPPCSAAGIHLCLQTGQHGFDPCPRPKAQLFAWTIWRNWILVQLAVFVGFLQKTPCGYKANCKTESFSRR